jgi:itaconyl-CoA hydratase
MSKCWEDFQVGQQFVTESVTVTETHVVNWASLTGDWYKLHMDEEYAKTTPFKGRIAHGPLIFALSMGLCARLVEYLGGSEGAFLGIDKMRALAPVRMGDTIHCEVEIIRMRETKQPDKGIFNSRHTVKNHRGEKVFEYEFAGMLNRRLT